MGIWNYTFPPNSQPVHQHSQNLPKQNPPVLTMATKTDPKASDITSSTTNENNPSGSLASMKALVQPYSGEEQIGSNDQDILDFFGTYK